MPWILQVMVNNNSETNRENSRKAYIILLYPFNMGTLSVIMVIEVFFSFAHFIYIFWVEELITYKGSKE